MRIPLIEVIRLCRLAGQSYTIPRVAYHYIDGIPVTRQAIRHCLNGLVTLGWWTEHLDLPEAMRLSYIRTQTSAWGDHADHGDAIAVAREDGATAAECQNWEEEIDGELLDRITLPTMDMLAYAIEQGQIATV